MVKDMPEWTPSQNRIREIDVVRGFALFGVFWMNLQQEGLTVPTDRLIFLAPPGVEKVIGFLGEWLIHGKEQALFSMLFGLGFALFLDQISQTREDGQKLYVRRLIFLLVIGVADAVFLWIGDILNAFAMMGFLLLFTRRWPSWLLLGVGSVLSIFSVVGLIWLTGILFPHHPASWFSLDSAHAGQRFVGYQAGDYSRFVRENARFLEAIGTLPIFAIYLLRIFGRFMLGSWMFRQAWFRALQLGGGLPRSFVILLPVGLLMALPGPVIVAMGGHPSSVLQQTADIVLALGYASSLILLYQAGKIRRLLDCLGDVGRMSLTNYLFQGLFYLLVLDGFGFDLLAYVGPTFSLAMSVAFFALQAVASRWWMSVFRFGPAEWIWRSFIYDKWLLLRRSSVC